MNYTQLKHEKLTELSSFSSNLEILPTRAGLHCGREGIMNDTHITINQIYTEMVYWWADQCDWLELIWTFGTSDLNIDWQKLLKQAIF